MRCPPARSPRRDGISIYQSALPTRFIGPPDAGIPVARRLRLIDLATPARPDPSGQFRPASSARPDPPGQILPRGLTGATPARGSRHPHKNHRERDDQDGPGQPLRGGHVSRPGPAGPGGAVAVRAAVEQFIHRRAAWLAPHVAAVVRRATHGPGVGDHDRRDAGDAAAVDAVTHPMDALRRGGDHHAGPAADARACRHDPHRGGADRPDPDPQSVAHRPAGLAAAGGAVAAGARARTGAWRRGRVADPGCQSAEQPRGASSPARRPSPASARCPAAPCITAGSAAICRPFPP